MAKVGNVRFFSANDPTDAPKKHGRVLFLLVGRRDSSTSDTAAVAVLIRLLLLLSKCAGSPGRADRAARLRVRFHKSHT